MKLRLPSDEWGNVGTPEHPIAVRMADGTWEFFGDGGGDPLYVRHGNTWKKWTSAGLGKFYTYHYEAGDHYNPVGYKSFDWYVGYLAGHRLLYERERYNGQVGVDEYGGNETGSLTAETSSRMEVVNVDGSEFTNYLRQTEENVTWYPLPVGLFIADAKETFESFGGFSSPPFGRITKAKLERVEIDFELEGYSIEQSTSGGGFGTTVTQPYPGVGAVRFLGTAPMTNTMTGGWPFFFSATQKTVAKAEPKTFVRESGGELIWTGNLNDLGWYRPNQPGYADIPERAKFVVTQTLTAPQLIDPDDSYLYHVQTAPLPVPPPIDHLTTNRKQNFLQVMGFHVKVIYRY